MPTSQSEPTKTTRSRQAKHSAVGTLQISLHQRSGLALLIACSETPPSLYFVGRLARLLSMGKVAMFLAFTEVLPCEASAAHGLLMVAVRIDFGEAREAYAVRSDCA